MRSQDKKYETNPIGGPPSHQSGRPKVHWPRGHPAAIGRLFGPPIYKQLYAHFSGLIQSGQLAKGARLPAARELVGSLGLNRTTVAAAYELLESEGFITGQVGRGSFVMQHSATSNRPLD